MCVVPACIPGRNLFFLSPFPLPPTVLTGVFIQDNTLGASSHIHYVVPFRDTLATGNHRPLNYQHTNLQSTQTCWAGRLSSIHKRGVDGPVPQSVPALHGRWSECCNVEIWYGDAVSVQFNSLHRIALAANCTPLGPFKVVWNLVTTVACHPHSSNICVRYLMIKELVQLSSILIKFSWPSSVLPLPCNILNEFAKLEAI